MGIGSGGIGQKLTAGGGITPEQASLAQYTMGQGEIADMSQFSQMPHSTNLTQAISGTKAAGVQQAGQMSQQDTAAMTQFLNQQNSQLTQGIGGAIGSIAGKGH